MSKRTLGLALIVLGAAVLVVSLAADVLGIGSRAGIGWKQLLGAAAGVIAAVGGGWLAQGKPSKDK